MEINNKRQLYKALNGRTGLRAFAIFLITLYPIIAIAMIIAFNDTHDTSTLRGAVLFGFIFGICMLSVTAQRTREAKRTMKNLKASGELDDAIADLGSDNAYTAEKLSPNGKERILHVVLGDKFLFHITGGKVMHFYQIKSLHRAEAAGSCQLSMVDSSGASLTLVLVSEEEEYLIDEFLEELRSRYPGCPAVS